MALTYKTFYFNNLWMDLPMHSKTVTAQKGRTEMAIKQPIFSLAILAAGALVAFGQTGPDYASAYSITTPKPISPAEGTTTPSAQATQRQNPYLGSVPAKSTGTLIKLSLQDSLARGLRYNLGLVESEHASSDVRADRLRALSALLPQVSATARQAYENISYQEIGLKLPAIPGLPALPATSGGFGYQDVRVAASQRLFDPQLRQRYQARKADEQASALSVKDARDVVVLAVGTAYFQVVASAARVETAKAQMAAAQEFDQLTANRVKNEVSPEIESLRAQVERQSAEQHLTNVTNQLEIDKLTFARITGLAIDQQFELTDKPSAVRLAEMTLEAATTDALSGRADLASAQAAVRAAESTLRAEKAQRLPVLSLSANYGGGGRNVGGLSQVYEIAGAISVPLYTGGRISADIGQAQADLERRRAEYEDLRGRIAYDVRVAWLDATASNSSVQVAEKNRALADRALEQSRDRYVNGVTNYLEVVQAQEAVAAANENTIQSLYSLDVATISLARAMGAAETRLPQLLGGK
ncbi:MAG: TolC family protein [Terriglobia bacterium]|nr:MAG: TolC family protein [Terriglobia bacterium]